MGTIFQSILKKKNRIIVVCVINSIEKIIKTNLKFTSIWKDEAHLHSNKDIYVIDSEKYVHMSATMPSALMMDDDVPNYTYSLGNSIRDKVVADYRLGIVFITKGDVMEASCKYVCTHPELYPTQVFCNSQDRVKIAYEKIKGVTVKP